MSQTNLVELKYISKARKEMNVFVLADIVSNSITFNSKNRITGIIFFDYGYFGQILEGELTNVEILWEKIKKDNRYHEIELLGTQDIQNRRFPNWSMKIFNTEEFRIESSEFSILVDNMLKPLETTYLSIKSLLSGI
jgi:hypothetical protein